MLDVLLDLDGVMADFHTAFQKRMKRKIVKYMPGEWNLDVVYGRDVGSAIATLPLEFWSTMPRTQYFSSVLELFDELNVRPIICTAPCSPASAAGKLLWCQNNLPGLEVILTKRKDLIDGCLIDDADHNISGRAHGILFPRIWNSLHVLEASPVDYVETSLKRKLYV